MENTTKAEPLTLKAQISQLIEPEDISIIMPVYNHEATVAEALESALMQEMPYRSVIYCLNDASTDKSAEVLNDYAQRYPERIKVYTSTTNQGSGKKSFYHNRPPIQGRYWCLLEGDDFWTSTDKLAKQISFLDAHSDYVGCSCNTVMKNELTNEESIIRPDKHTWNIYDLILLERRYAFYVHTSSITWRNIYLDQGYFLPPAFKKEYAQGDVVLMHMMLGKGGKVHNIDEVMSCYRVTGRGIWTGRSVKEQAEASVRQKENIKLARTFKCKIFLALQGIRSYSNNIKKLIPGPVNE